MRAVTHTRYGAPDVLEIAEVDRPTIGADEVLVQVHASTVTQGDRRMRAADFPGISAVLGRLMMGVRRPKNLVPGSMLAGRVVEVGANVTRFAVGDDVFASMMHGAYAEYTAVAADGSIARMPKGLSYAEAAALPYGAGTALTFLRDLAKVQPGEKVLVVGASGGVGRFAVQVAKHLGAEVTAVLSRDADLARELGATHVIDYTRAAVTGRYDVVFDLTETGSFGAYRDRLTATGRYLTVYMNVRNLFDMARTAVFGGPRAIAGVALPDPKHLEGVAALAESGAVRPVIAKRFDLEHIADAHRALEAGRLAGSVVVDVSPVATLRAVPSQAA